MEEIIEVTSESKPQKSSAQNLTKATSNTSVPTDNSPYSNYNPPISRRLMEGICGIKINNILKYEAEGVIIPRKVKNGGVEVVTYRISDVRSVFEKRGISYKKRKSADVIAVWSQKGGVGKSVCSQQLAAMLSLVGKVLVIDLDSQGDVTNLLDAGTKYTDIVRHTDELDPTIAELMDWTLKRDADGNEQEAGYNKLTFEQVVKKVSPYLDVIPAGLDLGEINFSLNKLPLSTDRFFPDGKKKSPPEIYMVSDVIDKIKNDYDYLVLDCAPNVEVLTLSALQAASRLLIPSELEAKSLMTMSRNEMFLRRLKEYEKTGVSFNWEKILIVPNKYKIENIKMKALAALQDLYRDRQDFVLSDVLLPLSSIIDKCQEAREPVFVSATKFGKEGKSGVKPAKEFTNYFWAIMHEILDVELNHLIFSEETPEV